MSKDLKSLIIQLNINDIQHLYKFKTAINSKHKIAITQTLNTPNKSARIAISCKQFCENLVKCGCIPRKSDILKFPDTNILPKELYKHFIRGYFDGDGCICKCEGFRIRKDRNNAIYPYVKYFMTFLGTINMLDNISEFLGDKNKYIKNTDYNYQLKFGGNQKIKSLMSEFYESANVYLDRKHEKYIELMNF